MKPKLKGFSLLKKTKTPPPTTIKPPSTVRVGVPASTLQKDKPNRKDKEEMVRLINSGEAIPEREDKKKLHAYHVGQIYYKTMETYYKTRFPMNWKDRLKSNPGSLGCCSRAWAQASILGCCVEDYIEAQFWAFDRYFRKHPRWQDIASPKALKRYEQWVGLVSKGEIPNKTVSIAIISTYSPRGNMSDVVVLYEQKVLRSMIQQWGSEQKVWSLFGELGDQDIFSDNFKRTRPLWRKMYEGKE